MGAFFAGSLFYEKCELIQLGAFFAGPLFFGNEIRAKMLRSGARKAFPTEIYFPGQIGIPI